MPEVNFLAVLVAAVASFAWGAFYYSPLAAGKMWMKEAGIKKSDMKGGSMAKVMVQGFVSNLLMAYVLSHVIWMAEETGVGTGISTGFWIWLGFIATLTAGSVIWEGKSCKLWFINNINWLVAFLLMGLIISSWN